MKILETLKKGLNNIFKDEKKEDIKIQNENFLKERFLSPFWVTLFLSEILINWKIFYITIFQNGEILSNLNSVTKIDYIERYFKEIFNIPSWWPTFLTWEILNNLLMFIWHFILLPTIFITIFIWIIPYFARKVSKKYEEDKKIILEDKIKAWDKNKGEYSKTVKEIDKENKKKEEVLEKDKKLSEELEKIKKENQIKKEDLTEEEKWELDFQEFQKNTEYYKDFGSLIDIVESHDSNATYNNFIQLDNFIKNYIFSLDLFIVHEQGWNEPGEMTITDKGKYFIKRFINLRQYKKSNKPKEEILEDVVDPEEIPF